MKKNKSLRLFSYEGDNSAWWLKQEDRSDLKKALSLWKKTKAKVGQIITTYPTSSVQSFPSFKLARKFAHKHCQHWYYIVELKISTPTICKLFDGVYGSDGPPCIIKKIYPLNKIQ